MKKKRLKRLLRRMSVAGPMGPQGVAGKDLSAEVMELGKRVQRMEELMGVQDSGRR
jgi:hypothetical protein